VPWAPPPARLVVAGPSRRRLLPARPARRSPPAWPLPQPSGVASRL